MSDRPFPAMAPVTVRAPARSVVLAPEHLSCMGRGGFRIEPGAARAHVSSCHRALDRTRRDPQPEAHAVERPWDSEKDAEQGASLGPIVPHREAGEIDRAAISLTRNGTLRRNGRTDPMILGIDGLLALLSRRFDLRSGDVIPTGTPAGVGPVAPGDRLAGRVMSIFDLAVQAGAPA